MEGSKLVKIKYKDIPRIKKKLIKQQNGLCLICQRYFVNLKSREICLDHNHKNGKIRAVLCRGCNSMEGKVYKAFVRMGLQKAGVDYYGFLRGLSEYLFIKETKYIHPKFKEKVKR